MKINKIYLYLILGLILRFLIYPLLNQEFLIIKITGIVLIFFIGIYLIRGTADIIAQTTGILKHRTGLAGGLLQALGTAFPDMVIGVVSALLSLKAASTDKVLAINLAIIAASTTFGSNIYNILHAAYCLWRQNLANLKNKEIFMFPGLKSGGMVQPFSKHKVKPHAESITSAMKILVFLSLLTTIVALSMVLFGKVNNVTNIFSGTLYQLSRPIGIVILIMSIGILYLFRKSHKSEETEEEGNPYLHDKTIWIWIQLVIAGIIILFSAESLVEAMRVFSDLTHFPYVLTGILTAFVGCLGEMIVIHNFTVHPQGRIADAVTGVAIDNIVTTMGAAFIAILGGIFLGSDALIIIFVMILFSNTLLMQEIAKLKNHI